jgi:hypothetical protein
VCKISLIHAFLFKLETYKLIRQPDPVDYKDVENYFAFFDSPSFTEQQVIDVNAAVKYAYILRLLFLVLASEF